MYTGTLYKMPNNTKKESTLTRSALHIFALRMIFLFSNEADELAGMLQQLQVVSQANRKTLGILRSKASNCWPSLYAKRREMCIVVTATAQLWNKIHMVKLDDSEVSLFCYWSRPFCESKIYAVLLSQEELNIASSICPHLVQIRAKIECSIKMARKNQEVNGDCNGKPRSPKNNSAVYYNSITSTKKEEKVFSRLSPSRTPSSTGSPGTSPRMSPGMLAGHYAGCKWSEPPLPSALPRPPQHWMPTTVSSVKCAFLPEKTDQQDAYPFKVLLNAQA
ncbi:hypothetical protein FQR65_LT11841 [Abscondita terminalis]|nr:hypothetical protein FQR65_LT11841 [Abscondita terminalis]